MRRRCVDPKRPAAPVEPCDVVRPASDPGHSSLPFVVRRRLSTTADFQGVVEKSSPEPLLAGRPRSWVMLDAKEKVAQAAIEPQMRIARQADERWLLLGRFRAWCCNASSTRRSSMRGKHLSCSGYLIPPLRVRFAHLDAQRKSALCPRRPIRPPIEIEHAHLQAALRPSASKARRSRSGVSILEPCCA
jgi:hypothetical protein